MASFNNITILGNVTRDLDMRYLPSHTPVVEFGMATNRKFKAGDGTEREETFFADLVAFGKQAEVLNQYVQKGNLLFVTARAKTESWEKDGHRRSKVVFVIENFQLMPRRDGGEEGVQGQGQSQPPRRAPAPAPARQAPRPVPQQQQQPADQSPFDDQQQFKGDDIPF